MLISHFYSSCQDTTQIKSHINWLCSRMDDR